MAKLNEKQKLLVLGATSLLLCGAAGGGIWWAEGLIEEVVAQTEQKQQEISKADQQIAKIPAAENEVIILRENLDEYVKILPDDSALIQFVRTLNHFQRQSGVQPIALTSGRAARATGKNVERFAKTQYSYEMTATLWQFLKFISFIENLERFVNITDFTITAGGKGRARAGEDETREGEVVHTIRLVMETYTYEGKAAGQDVAIPNYESKRDALREEIFKRLQMIRLEKHEHRGMQGRRDIFVDPRQRGDLGPGGPSPAEQREVLERYVGQLQTLNDMLLRMRKPDTTLFDRYTLEKNVRDGIESLAGAIQSEATRITFPPYRLRWQKEVLQPLEDLRGQVDALAKGAGGAFKDPWLPLPDLTQMLADMDQDLQSGNLEQAKARYEAVVTKLQVPPDDPRHPLAVQARAMHTKATVAMEFRAMDLRIQGVVVQKAGRSGVLLNGNSYEEGDYFSDDLLVKAIEEEQVWFVFKGLTLIRTM